MQGITCRDMMAIVSLDLFAMGDSIPIRLQSRETIPIDGTLVAHALGMDSATFRRLMDQGKIKTLCERGTGEDEGVFRISFYHNAARVRLVVDPQGALHQPMDIRPDTA